MGFLERWRRSNPLQGLRRGERRAFQELTRSLALIGDPDSLEASIAARLQDLLGIERMAAFQPHAEGGRFRLSYQRRFDDEGIQRLEHLAISRRGRLATWLRTNERPLVIDLRAKGPATFIEPELLAVLRRLGVRACLPLLSFNRLIGIILLAPIEDSWRPTVDELELLGLISTQGGLAVENALLDRRNRRRLRRLDRAERLATIGQLAAGIAHEVRNPLTAIRSTVQFVVGRQAPADAAERTDTHTELLEDVLREVDRIDGIVEGLLSLAPTAVRKPGIVDVCEVVDEATRLLAHEARQRNVDIHQRADPSETCFPVAADAAELKQVMLNLLLNGMQAMASGGTLDVHIQGWQPPFVTDGGHWVEVRIRDHGICIAEADRERIFDPFFTTKRGGTGLGLAICDGIVARYDGDLRLEPHPGGGTMAVIRLPVVAGELDAEDAAQAGDSDPSSREGLPCNAF